MVKLDVSLMRFLEEEDYRCLTALEMSMRNHEVAPTALIERIAGLAHGGVKKRLKHLLKHKLIHHESKHYDGYCMKYQSYDFLALRTFSKRGTVTGVGSRVGCGKESDIIHVEDENGMEAILKLQRLGRCSFRSVARNRDYKNGKDRRGASWFYLSRLAAQKEFAFMKMLYDEGFPVPKPIDQNRHAVVMEYINGVLLNNIETMLEAQEVYERALKLVVKLAEHGLIHGDFNEFNILITDDLKVIMIDFPQMVSTDHPNATELFDRDIKNLSDFFVRRFRIPTPYYPKLETDIKRVATLDRQAMASGHFTKKMQQEMDQLIRDQTRKAEEEAAAGRNASDDDSDAASEVDGDVPEDADANDGAVKRTAEERAAAKARRLAAMAKLEKPTGEVEEGNDEEGSGEEDEGSDAEDEPEPEFQKQKRLTKQEEKALQAAQPRAPRKIKIVSRTRNGLTTVATVDASEVIVPSKPMAPGTEATGDDVADAEGELDNTDIVTTATEARTRLRTTAKVDLKEVSAKVKRIGIREDDRDFARNLHRNTQKGREKAKIKNQLKTAHGADFF